MSLFRMLTQVQVNPENGKCRTLPLLSLRSQYSRNFHLSWLGFWVAFLSWFAFSPLVPQAVKTDLHLTNAQIGNSNIISLCSTLLVRIIVGPLVDMYGPRKVMAGILIVGAIPSGLAGTITSANGLYVVRFFIGILGGTFVPCQAWTSAFFDTNVVGRANALAGGWGNSGGGFTFIIMLAVYNALVRDGLSHHVAWRAAFAIVPVPILLATAAATLIFGTDHPNGKWSDRHRPFGDDSGSAQSSIDDSERGKSAEVMGDKEGAIDGIGGKEDTHVVVQPASPIEQVPALSPGPIVRRPLSRALIAEVLMSPITWLPTLAYLTTFGFELSIDANLSNVLYGMYSSKSFGQTKAGYIASIYGLLNVCTRAFGGYLGDVIYRYYGVAGKKYLTLALGVAFGLLSVGLGVYIDSKENPSLAVVIVVFVIMGLFDQAGNGANFSLVPHCNPSSNGLMTGIVGAVGNLGGVFFALIWRLQPLPYGKAFWISGAFAAALNLLLLPVRAPEH